MPDGSKQYYIHGMNDHANATIEAARAGDAGRGFTVVASEVRDLARKTSEATADISKRISGIQGDSKAARSAVVRITDIVGKINDFQQSIASAVEEQSATNKELAGNIGQVAQAGSEISANVNAVARTAKEAATGAGETLKAANELAKLATDLRQAVARFRTCVSPPLEDSPGLWDLARHGTARRGLKPVVRAPISALHFWSEIPDRGEDIVLTKSKY